MVVKMNTNTEYQDQGLQCKGCMGPCGQCEVKTYAKVWLPGDPTTYYVTSLEESIKTLKYTIEEDDESEGVCFAPIHMTMEEFENLPDFTGF